MTQFESLLLKGGLTADELQTFRGLAREQEVRLLDVLLREKRITEETLAEMFTSLNIPRLRVASASVEPEALAKLSEKLARKHVCLPVKVERKSLVIAMANPLDYEAMQDIQFASGLDVKPLVATRTEVLDGIAQHYAPDDRLREFVAHVTQTDDFRILREKTENGDEDGPRAPLASTEVPPVVKLCNLMIYDAIKADASDIHVEPGLNDIQVRMRIDGVLRSYTSFPKWLHDPVVSRLKILARMDIAERRVPQDGKIKVEFRQKPLDVRVSTLPTHFGEKVVMRILGSGRLAELGGLGFTAAQLRVIEGALNQPQGLILVTGPTGSGKTTSLYSMLTHRRSAEVNTVTIEDPIEYQLPGIAQVQVNVKAGLTFVGALRSILRQDPDVILLGEIRDLETAEIAFQAAMTGHLVLTTLHTNNSIATIARLVDLGVDPFLITSSVSLIVAQRLVRRICDHCKEVYTPAADVLDKLRAGAQLTAYRGRGCVACAQTGYSGRTGIYELLRMTPALKQMVNRKATEADMRKAAAQDGTGLLLDHARELLRAGVTTPEEILRVVQIDEDETIRCPQCGASIQADFSTCPYCRHTLQRACASCHQELKLEWKACPYCNTAADAPVPGDQLIASRPVKGLLPTGQARILVVDDDAMIHVAVAAALNGLERKPEIVRADDGMDALAEIERKVPDLIILDVNMPRLDGFAVCERLRKDLRTAFVPILMLTGSTDEGNRTKGYLVGTDDYMAKPFSVPELTARVTRLLRRTYGL